MAETDSPFKRLVDSAILDFAEWLLDAEVEAADAVNVELPGELVRVDQLFHVRLKNGRTTLLHIEFQGKSTHRPMKWRMLEYMSRLAAAEPELDLFSVVFYVGQGAGSTDTGDHQVSAPGGAVSIQWKYKVVHVWKMQAQTLLALQRPGLLPLIGQAKLDDPETQLPQVVEALNQVEDAELRQRLLASLLALVQDKEMATMVEKLIEEEGLLMDTPFLQRLRQKAHDEGRQQARRETILEVLTLRFDPAISIYRELESSIAKIKDEVQLERLFTASIKAPTLADFQTTLQQVLSPAQGPA